MEEIIKLPACSGDKPSTLKYVFDKINVNLRELASLGIDTERYGSLLIPIVMTKLPSELRLHIARETDKDVWEIDELLAVIKKEVEVREATEYIKLHQVAKNPNAFQSPIHSIPTASIFVAGGSSVRCVYNSASCVKVRTPQERTGILVKAGRCFNCLKTNHKSHNCESSKTCRYCNCKHH